MKRKNIIAFSVALMAIGAFTSCSDEFLQDKKNYDYVDASTYNTFSGAKARVDDIYAWCLPNTSSEPSWKYNSTGAADLQSKSTEEYSGFGSFVDPDAPMTSQSGNNTVPDYFHNSGNNIQASVWVLLLRHLCMEMCHVPMWSLVATEQMPQLPSIMLRQRNCRLR